MNTLLVVIAVLLGVAIFVWLVFALLNEALQRDELLRSGHAPSVDMSEAAMAAGAVVGTIAAATSSS